MSGVHALIFNDGMTSTGTWARSGGAYRIATHLRSMGLRVQVIDFWSYLCIEDESLTDLLLEKFVGSDTIFVGFSSTFYNLRLQQTLGFKSKEHQGFYTKHVTNNTFATTDQRMQHIRDVVKKINPNTHLLLAGARATRNTKFVDVVLFGYGEIEVERYVNWWLGKNPFFMPTREDGKLIIEDNPTAEGFDFTRSTIHWTDEDCIQPGESLPIEISRGCIFRCKFCSFPLNGRGKLDYLKDMNVLREELIRNYEKFGVRKYMFSDDTYNDTTYKLEWMNEVLKELPFKIEFATYGRLDLIAKFPEHADLIMQNGCTSITFGIESLNRKAAASIGKGADPAKLIETLYTLRDKWKNNIHTSSGFILGLPHDTYDTMYEWTEQLIDVRFPLHNSIFIPLGIADIKVTQKKFVSDFDQDPAKYGYELLKPAGWKNPRFGTDSQGCEEMAKSITNYVTKQGRDHYGSHVLIGVEGDNLSREQSLLLGAYGVNLKFNMLSFTYQRWLSYLGDIMRLDV